MTTFKNNPRYAELLFTYLELAERGITPIKSSEILGLFAWKFKGGDLGEMARSTRLKPETSGTIYPDGFSWELAPLWEFSRECGALRRIVHARLNSGKMRHRAVMGRLGTLMAMTSVVGQGRAPSRIYSGMKSVYKMFGDVWDWSPRKALDESFQTLQKFSEEMVIAAGASSKVYLPLAKENTGKYLRLLSESRVPGLHTAARQVKEIMMAARSKRAMNTSKVIGMRSKERWVDKKMVGSLMGNKQEDLLGPATCQWMPLGPMVLSVFQGAAMLGMGEVRFALSNSDLERLHQMIMSAMSSLVGVSAQSVIGTGKQKTKAARAVEVAEANIGRIVKSSRLVALGDEVLVCKGYRRAYTAHLGWLAGKMCSEETAELIKEAEATAPGGVLDVEGMLYDARTLDAAGSLNSTKMFKICPAPDVSPGQAMMDRVEQIGNGNIANPDMLPMFEKELKAQVLRAFIRSHKGRLELRDPMNPPSWIAYYRKGEYDRVPSSEIDSNLVWEGAASMPDISRYDPKHWKDSGIGADSIRQSASDTRPRHTGNMLTRLLYDEDCPMPGRQILNDDHVIKFFIKAEGHKDPARGIFSANLTDRQAQSWMEKAVEVVATHHPSFMIGTEMDIRQAKIAQLTALPERRDFVPLYYSFDISGWSAKMPGEPQRISHKLWGDLYGGHLFRRACEINEGAHIYMSLDGYEGWFKNTHANLEGFNAKEMTMILIAMLSLSVRRWRSRVVDMKLMTKDAANEVAALLFAYIDDGLSRIDLPRAIADEAFKVYRDVVIETFSGCGFNVEVSKCFPSHRFAIFLNEVYLGGRHVVHGVRAAMGICSEPTERHSTLVERITTVATGCRGAVMAGLNPLSAVMLMAFHAYMHIREWVHENDPVIMTTWCMCPRSWGGLGMPNVLQLYVSGSGAAFEEGVVTLQCYARHNEFARAVFLHMCKLPLEDRTATGALTAPLSAKVTQGYMVDSRVSAEVRKALRDSMGEGKLSSYATRLLRYANDKGFFEYAESVVAMESKEVVQEQMLNNAAEAHPHSIFSAFARRVEKSATVTAVIGPERFLKIIDMNREEAVLSAMKIRQRGYSK